jgi:hypothetical protein
MEPSSTAEILRQCFSHPGIVTEDDAAASNGATDNTWSRNLLGAPWNPNDDRAHPVCVQLDLQATISFRQRSAAPNDLGREEHSPAVEYREVNDGISAHIVHKGDDFVAAIDPPHPRVIPTRCNSGP